MKLFFSYILFFSLINVSHASSITSTTANVLQGGNPASLQLNMVESNDALFVYSERNNILLDSDLMVNFSGTGSYQPVITNEAPTDLISSGTVIDSYLIHFDSLNDSNINLTGSITFDNDIIGIIGSHQPLVATDSWLGMPGTTYETGAPANGGRGVEGLDFTVLSSRDTITVSEDGNTLYFDMGVGIWFDDVRIIVASEPVEVSPVPVPPSLLLFVSGLIILFTRRIFN